MYSWTDAKYNQLQRPKQMLYLLIKWYLRIIFRKFSNVFICLSYLSRQNASVSLDVKCRRNCASILTIEKKWTYTYIPRPVSGRPHGKIVRKHRHFVEGKVVYLITSRAERLLTFKIVLFLGGGICSMTKDTHPCSKISTDTKASCIYSVVSRENHLVDQIAASCSVMQRIWNLKTSSSVFYS